jgi:hypothetical protein
MAIAPKQDLCLEDHLFIQVFHMLLQIIHKTNQCIHHRQKPQDAFLS